MTLKLPVYLNFFKKKNLIPGPRSSLGGCDSLF